MLDALLGGLVSGGLGLLGSSMTNDANARASAEANALNKHMFETRYQTSVKDMQAAGLNPMLAYSQGGGTPPVMQPPPPKHDVVASAVGGFTGQMQREILKQQAINMAKEGELTSEKIATQKNLTLDALESANLKFDQARQITQNIRKEKFSEPFYEGSAKNQADKLLQDVLESKQRIVTGSASAGQYKAMTDKLRQDLRLQGYDEQRLKNLSEAEKSAIKSKLSPYLPELKLLLQALP
jgi:hypothetical protein